MDIAALCQCLHPYVPVTTRRQFSRLALAMLVMAERVTMLGLAGRTDKEGSYWTVQSFSSTVIWMTVFWSTQ